MSRRPYWHAWLLALICAAVLWARAGGAHLHLCFDGSEPPASVHLSAGAHHADGHAGFHEHHGDHDAGEVHNDLDVPLADSPLAKPGKLVQDLPLFLLAAVALFAFLGSPRQRPRFREPPALLPWALLHLLPPLRGPPADGRGRQRASA